MSEPWSLRRPSWEGLPRVAWLPVALFLIAIVVLKLDEPSATFEHPYLLLLLNLLFSLAASALVIALLSRTFVEHGTADLLLFSCGLTAWALAGLVGVGAGLATFETRFDNVTITVHNLCVWLAGAGQLAGAALALRPRPLIRRPGLWLVVGQVVVVALVGGVALASLAGWTPAFFVPGRGGTALRQGVMYSASAMFAAAAVLVLRSAAGGASGREARRASRFEWWYAAALAMIAVGLLGVTLQTVAGGALGWAGRTAQLLSGVYLVVAAVVAVRQSRLWGLPLVVAAREAAERYQRLFDASADGLWIHDLGGRIREVNDAYCRLSGYPRDEIVGTPVSSLDSGATAAYVGGVVDGGGHYRFESRHRRKDGTLFDVDVTAVHLRIDDGRVAVSVRDVTERKRAEETLRLLNAELEERVAARTAELARAADEVRAERERFLGVLETLPVMVTLIRPDFHVPFANRAYREALGEARGRPCYEYQFGRGEPCEECQAFLPLRTGQPHHWEWTLPDGRTFEIYNFPFTDADGSPMILEMDIDVTERRRAERELRAAHGELAARAEQLRRLAGEATLAEQRERRRLARVLHDHLQQLLVAARLRTSVLSRAADEAVVRAAGQIEALLDESLAASRSLTAELSPPISHEGGLGAGLSWLGRWMADTHGLEVVLSVEEPLPRLPEDVRVLLFESVRELLFNAVKHAQASRVEVSLRRLDDGRLEVGVSDSGPGFDPAALKRIGGVGGGLGLFSIRERLGLVGGRVEIDSVPGRGSRVVLVVPPEAATAATR